MSIDVRNAVHPDHAKGFDTKALRSAFLVETVFEPGKISLTYSHHDRIIFGGVCPTTAPLHLEPSKDVLATEYFLERRELGFINLGGAGAVEVDGTRYDLGNRDGFYIGMGAREVGFTSTDADDPARIYCVSTTAHHAYPAVHIPFADAKQVHLGSNKQSNNRTIYQYVHPAILESCQLAMGMTLLEPENVWNTMPCHMHDRRMEVYFYTDIDPDAMVLHLMGPPEETRHLVVRNDQAVISPNWSLHSGVGTANYSFIWAMAGENLEFTDVDPVPMQELL
jgi:4-deoxy-L-threo-5-hexosulose-uronate ketol-isomerase